MVSRIIFIAIVSVSLSGAIYGQTYTNKSDSIAGSTEYKRNAKVQARNLSMHPEKNLPEELFTPFMQMVEKQEDGWIDASYALILSKDERVVSFYIQLLQDNFYAKEEDGSRKQYGWGSENGCTAMPFLYGGVLASSLGNLGDKRAVAVLEEAVKQGDYAVKHNAYEALYKLEAISLDQLFEMAKTNADPSARIPDLISKVGNINTHSNTQFSISVFDRIIAELQDHQYTVASAHYSKIECYELLKQYKNALRECDQVMKFSQFDNLTKQIDKKRMKLKLLSQKTAQK